MSRIFTRGVAAAILLSFFSQAYAEVVVVDAAVTSSASPAASPPRDSNAQLLYQLQLLQQEILSIRGALEEQQQELRALKQQRLDDYLNMDRRLSDLAQGSPRPAVQPAAASSPSLSENASPTPASDQDRIDFNAAYELVRGRKLEEARQAFVAFLKKYPESSYVPNACYWMGALLFIDGDLLKAKSYFERVATEFPSHAKYPEALYKLAEISYELGDRPTAKIQMEGLVRKYSPVSGAEAEGVVRKARAFLEEHYP